MPHYNFTEQNFVFCILSVEIASLHTGSFYASVPGIAVARYIMFSGGEDNILGTSRQKFFKFDTKIYWDSRMK